MLRSHALTLKNEDIFIHYGIVKHVYGLFNYHGIIKIDIWAQEELWLHNSVSDIEFSQQTVRLKGTEWSVLAGLECSGLFDIRAGSGSSSAFTKQAIVCKSHWEYTCLLNIFTKRYSIKIIFVVVF